MGDERSEGAGLAGDATPSDARSAHRLLCTLRLVYLSMYGAARGREAPEHKKESGFSRYRSPQRPIGSGGVRGACYSESPEL